MNYKRVLRNYFDRNLSLSKCLQFIKNANFIFGLLFGVIFCLCLSLGLDECSFISLTKNDSPYHWFESIINLDFNPVVNINLLNKSSSEFKLSIKRPRSYLDELNFKDALLFVVVTNTQTVHDLGKTVNSTVHSFASKLLFFMESSFTFEATPSVIILPNNNNNQKKYHIFDRILEYLQTTEINQDGDSYIYEYQFIFFTADTSYVKISKLSQLINQYSQRKPIYLTGEISSCYSLDDIDLQKGILINYNLILKCSINRHCWQKYCYNRGFLVDHINYDNNDESIIVDQKLFEKSLITFPIYSSNHYYNIHYLWLQMYLKNIKINLTSVEDTLSMINENIGYSNIWPIGTDNAFKAKDRFDLTRWWYFNETHSFMPNEYDVILPLKYSDKDDFTQIKYLCKQYLINKYQDLASFKIKNIYRKLDFNRGYDYIIDIKMFLYSGFYQTIRLQILRPLNPIEIINKVPFVTEHNKIVLNIIVKNVKEIVNVLSFMNQYVSVCLKRPDHQTMLMIVLIQPYHFNIFPSSSSSSSSTSSSSSSPYSPIMSLAYAIQARYKHLGSKVAYLTITTHNNKIPNEIAIIDLILKKYSNKLHGSLLLNCHANMILSIDYLDRVQMNTINGYQVFFPIPFIEYRLRPSSNHNSHNTWPITKENGRFNSNEFSFYSFYLDDYHRARKLITNDLPICQSYKDINKSIYYERDLHIIDMFLKYNCAQIDSKLNIMRAIEPELKIRYSLSDCDNQNLKSKVTCNYSVDQFLGNKAQLASVIFKYKNYEQN